MSKQLKDKESYWETELKLAGTSKILIKDLYLRRAKYYTQLYKSTRNADILIICPEVLDLIDKSKEKVDLRKELVIFANKVEKSEIVKQDKKKQKYKSRRDNKPRKQEVRINYTSKGELQIIKYLEKNNIRYNREQEFKELVNPKTNCNLRFDFFLPDANTCIEFDGAQHFMYIPEFHGTNKVIGKKKLEDQKSRDKIKDEFCKDKHIDLIRISYKSYQNIENILNEKLNWFKTKNERK